MIALYIILAIVVFLVLIMVHELGHYTAGKLLKFKINEFSIGFGKAIFSKTNKNTGEKFSIRIFPLGGYCAFEGEDEDNPNPEAFNNQKAWKRLIVLFSGVFFNFLFGILFAGIYLLVAGYYVPKINYVLPDSPNAIVLFAGDEIEKVNGKSIEAYRDLSELIDKYDAGEPMLFTVKRNGKLIDVEVQKYSHSDNYYIRNKNNISKLYIKEIQGDNVSFKKLNSEAEVIEAIINANGNLENLFFSENGLAFTSDEVYKLLDLVYSSSGTNLGILFEYSARNYGFFEAMGKAFPFCFKICWLILCALGGLFVGKTKLDELGGTITAISQVAEFSQLGIEAFLYLIPVLSMNLALFNFLPIPALDGARFLFVLIEMIFRKPVPRKIEAWIHMIGLFVLLALVVFLDFYHFLA